MKKQPVKNDSHASPAASLKDPAKQHNPATTHPSKSPSTSLLVKEKAKVQTIEAQPKQGVKVPLSPTGDKSDQKQPDSPKDVPVPPLKKPGAAKNNDKDTIADAGPGFAETTSHRAISPATGIVMPILEKNPLPHSRLNFIGIFFAALTLLGSMGYIAATILSALDKKGKETYFIEDPTVELPFRTGVQFQILQRSWTLTTDDWGWFQRAHEINDSFWSKYDVFYALFIVGGVCGIYWLIFSITELVKYCRNSTGRATCVLFF